MIRIVETFLTFIVTVTICVEVEWGSNFGRLDSHQVNLDCSHTGQKICCNALDEDPTVRAQSRGIGEDYALQQKYDNNIVDVSKYKQCSISKKYIPSPFELQNLEFAKRNAKLPKAERLEDLLQYTFSKESIHNTTIWLNRVAEHMKTESSPIATDEDYYYLSRFEFTMKCNSNSVIIIWNEWIEPLVAAGRNPFSFFSCDRYDFSKYNTSQRVDVLNVDYILLKSGKELAYVESYRATERKKSHTQSSTPSSSSTQIQPSRTKSQYQRQHRRKHFLLDAGTSTYDSSLFWLTCAYSQRKISFDHVYGWEATLLEPNHYWERVPPIWKPYMTFYNIPISKDYNTTTTTTTTTMSVLKMIQQIATLDDFISFKLDIDTPFVELKIVSDMMNMPYLSSLIDEFFFELHFQCEMMLLCGWEEVPESIYGLKLDRPHVLQFFMEMRYKGIRAHMWP